MHRAEERDVALPQLEHGPGADGPGEHRVADQGPGLAPGQLSLILKEKIFLFVGPSCNVNLIKT